jgi:predicted transcriptional regulator
MSKQISEKEKLLSMLTGIYDQLEELELVLEKSFSDARNKLNMDEHKKISTAKEHLSKIESKTFPMNTERLQNVLSKDSRSMKLELGF